MGTTEITLEVTDAGGGTDSDDAFVTVVVTPDALCDLVIELMPDDEGVALSMCQQLANATTVAFENHVNAQSGKALTEDAALALLSLAAEL